MPQDSNTLGPLYLIDTSISTFLSPLKSSSHRGSIAGVEVAA